MNPQLVGAFLVFGVAISSAAAVEPSEDWLSRHGELFNFRKDGDTMKSDEVLSKLKDLRDSGSEWSESRYMEIVNTLIDANAFKPEKCNLNYLDDLEILIERYEAYSKTLHPYLEEQKFGLYDYCKSQSIESLDKILESFDKDTRDKMQEVKRIFSEVDKSKFYSEKQRNKEATCLLEYLEAKKGAEKLRDEISGEGKNRNVDKKKLRKLISEEFSGFCQQMTRDLMPPMESFQMFGGHPKDGAENADSFLEHWSSTGAAASMNLCDYFRLTQRTDALASQMYWAYLKVNPKASNWFDGMLSKMKN